MAVNTCVNGVSMANLSKIHKFFAISPHVEMIARRLYWNNVKRLSGQAKKQKKKLISAVSTPIAYDDIGTFLKENGVTEGRLLLVHSAFAPLKGRGKTPNQVLEYLFELIGSSGTLAMPAMVKYKNEIKPEDYLTADLSGEVFHYDVSKSGVKTGVLPLMLHKRKGSIRSRYPINTMVAEGPLAKTLFEDEFKGKSPLACGMNSAWKKCIDHDALIVGLGTDLTHSLTAIHVAEDSLDSEWPIKNWYIEKTFRITDGDFESTKVLKERAPKWGALHFAERTLCKNLLEAHILKSTVIDDIQVEILSAKDLIRFLEQRNTKGYPYFWV